MDWQLATALGAISLAGVYFALSAYRAWQSSKAGACGGGCGCAKAAKQEAPPLISAEQLMVRMQRKD